MPNRILKGSIRESDDINQLSWFEEVLFYRLIVSCDDYGRFDGRDLIIKNTLFPLKDNLTVRTVHEAIEKLASVGLVTLYEYEGKPYLYLPTWDDHQNVRAHKSKYPAPENNVNTSEYICMQMNTDVCKCSRNPIQSESVSVSESVSESESNARTRAGSTSTAQEQAFEEFWALYPKKKSKGQAKKAWEKLKPSSETIDAIMEKLPELMQTRDWTKDGGQYIPYPATWLNARGWEDEIMPDEQGESSNIFLQMLKEGAFDDE